MHVAWTVRELHDITRRLPRPFAFVPTMGALHAGHLALVEAARAEGAAFIAVSIFVNPLQFGPGEDFERYPRAFPDDCAVLEAAGVGLVFAPSVEEIYPAGFAASVDPGPLGSVFEGAIRPGHFRGVATVCTKLFSAVGAERAYFGEKDAQQIAVLRRVIADLSLPVDLRAVPTVRETDGLALSSRNVYLSAEERAAAPALYRALREVADAVQGGASDRAAITRARRHFVAPLREAYLDVVDPGTFAPLQTLAPPAIVIGSVYAGKTRLIDNIPLAIAAERAA
ncbi:MAG: pantoate--beta-alanine ligase [Candidatus Velthaea sp.]